MRHILFALLTLSGVVFTAHMIWPPLAQAIVLALWSYVALEYALVFVLLLVLVGMLFFKYLPEVFVMNQKGKNAPWWLWGLLALSMAVGAVVSGIATFLQVYLVAVLAGAGALAWWLWKEGKFDSLGVNGDKAGAEKRKDMIEDAIFLKWASVGVVIVSLLLTAIGAWEAYSGLWGSLALVLAFLSIAAARHRMTKPMLTWYSQGKYALLGAVLFLQIGMTGMLVVTSWFAMVDDYGAQRDEKLVGSSKVESLQAQIAERERLLASLTKEGYADAGSANAEAERIAAANSQNVGRVADLEQRKSALLGKIQQVVADNARYMSHAYSGTDVCTPKHDRRGAPYTTLAAEACAQIAPLRAEMTRSVRKSAAWTVRSTRRLSRTA